MLSWALQKMAQKDFARCNIRRQKRGKIESTMRICWMDGPQLQSPWEICSPADLQHIGSTGTDTWTTLRVGHNRKRSNCKHKLYLNKQAQLALTWRPLGKVNIIFEIVSAKRKHERVQQFRLKFKRARQANLAKTTSWCVWEQRIPAEIPLILIIAWLKWFLHNGRETFENLHK